MTGPVRRLRSRGALALAATLVLLGGLTAPAGAESSYDISIQITTEFAQGTQFEFRPGETHCLSLPGKQRFSQQSSQPSVQITAKADTSGDCLFSSSKGSFSVVVLPPGQSDSTSWASFEIRQQGPHWFSVYCGWRQNVRCSDDSGLFFISLSMRPLG